jgi:hypothetical protein
VRNLALRAAERLHVIFDAVPVYEDERWYRYGDWGCRASNWVRRQRNKRR